MKKEIYTIYDKVAALHNTPFFTVNPSVADRLFDSMKLRKDTDLFSSPDDFILVHHGQYDDETGTFLLNKK